MWRSNGSFLQQATPPPICHSQACCWRFTNPLPCTSFQGASIHTPHKQETVLFHVPQTACTLSSFEKLLQKGTRYAWVILTWFILSYGTSVIKVRLNTTQCRNSFIAKGLSLLHQARQYLKLMWAVHKQINTVLSVRQMLSNVMKQWGVAISSVESIKAYKNHCKQRCLVEASGQSQITILIR